MLKIAVVHEAPRPTWTSRRLLEAIREMGHKPLYLLAPYLSTNFTSTTCILRYRGKCIDVDAVIVRSLGRSLTVEKFLARLAILEHLEKCGVLVVNPAESLRVARDKCSSIVRLSHAGVPVPPTVVTEDPMEALRVIEEWKNVVIKPVVGSLGLGSFHVDNIDLGYRIVSVLSSLGQPIYIQKYVEKKGNRDIRAFVVGDRVIAAVYRIAPPGSWKTNIAQGAKAVPIKLDPHMEEIAVRAAKVLNLYYSGVDMAETVDGKVYVFEANASPLWRGLYEATNVDPAYHIVKLIVEHVKK